LHYFLQNSSKFSLFADRFLSLAPSDFFDELNFNGRNFLSIFLK